MKEISQLEAIQIRKNLLYSFHDLCIQHNLEYSIGYGTLLGAVRHQGMIPWDDDVDVIMPRDSFDRLSTIYESNMCLDQYQFVCHKNHPEIKTKIGYYIDFSTITETAYETKEYHGIHIDIYPVDIVPNDRLRRKLFFFQRSILHTLIRAKDIHPMVVTGMQKLIRETVLVLCSPFSYDATLDSLHKIAKKYNNLPDREKKEAVIFVETGKPLCFPYEVIVKYSQYKFEDHILNGFEDYDTVLTAWYGDYMKPPAEAERHLPDHAFVKYYYK